MQNIHYIPESKRTIYHMTKQKEKNFQEIFSNYNQYLISKFDINKNILKMRE